MKTWIVSLSLALLTAGGYSARAEIFERDLGTNAGGEAVSGYVFQAGRSHRGVSSLRSRGLQPRRVARSGRTYGRTYRSYGFPYWYVPVIPLHCGGRGYGGSFSIWHGSPSHSGVTVTVVR